MYTWLCTYFNVFSVEVIRLGLSILINLDTKMYYEPNDVPAIARYVCVIFC